MVLIFNGAQVLVAVTRSLHSAAELTKGNLQASHSVARASMYAAADSISGICIRMWKSSWPTSAH